MGRHRLPDPEDSPDDGRHDEAETERFGQPVYGTPDYRGSDWSGYQDPSFEEPFDDEPAFDEGFDVEDRRDDTSDTSDTSDIADTSDTSVPRFRSGPQHTGGWENGEWTGSHRAVTTGRRPVSVGVIVALVTVVVLVGAFILWRFFGDALSSRSDVAAARCVDGELAVAVLADPSISEHVQTLANTYNETAAPVGDRCVKVGVKPAAPDQVVNGLTDTWPAELGERPALWIPASSVSAARLQTAAEAKIVSDSRSLVTSPVLLAVRPPLKQALAQQNWATLPALQTNPMALDALGLAGWGPLRLALPRIGDSDASYLAAEAVAAASAPDGQPPSAGLGAVNSLLAGQPELTDDTGAAAMDALVGARDPASAPVHAVVTTEQQLYQKASSLPDAKDVLAGWLPPGPTAMADYPTVLLTGDWLSQEQVRAASEFSRFMRKPEQLADLAAAGFRTEGGTPPQSDVTDFAPVSEPLSVGDDAQRATLADALTAPSGPPAVTVMLDQSMPNQEGGTSRLANVVTALDARLQALPPDAAVGLWTFDGVRGQSEVPTGPLSEPVDGRPRSDELSAALDSQTASGGGAVSYTTLRLVYEEAKKNYREGQQNSILVITTGPHTDRTLDGAGLQDFIRGAFDPARPIAVNVIDFDSDSDRPTWEAVAQISGGGYENLASSASPELTAAIARFVA
ncbi:hypothetical protein [Mycolicibacterium sp. XJ1819]